MSSGISPELGRGPVEPLVIRRYGSVAEIWNFDEISSHPEGDQRTLYRYRQPDHETPPISQAEISAMRASTATGEECMAYQSTITLNRDLSKTYDLFSRMLQPNQAGNIPYSSPPAGTAADLRLEQTPVDRVFKATAKKTGGEVLIFFDELNNNVVLTNHGGYRNGATATKPETTVQVEAQASGTIDPRAQLETFTRVLMHTMDYAAGSFDSSAYYYDQQPTNQPVAVWRLNQRYVIGQETRSRQAAANGSARRAGAAAVAPNVERRPQTPARSNPRDPERRPAASRRHEKKNIAPALEALGLERMNPNVTLDDVGGLPKVKEEIIDIADTFLYPDIVAEYGGKRPTGVLLYGPAGTGKTLITQALANTLGGEAWMVRSNDIYSKYVSEATARLEAIFAAVKGYQDPLVLFFDEFDSIVSVPEGKSGADQERASVAGAFKDRFNNLATDTPGLIVAAATNFPGKIDPSLIRSGRFDVKILIPLPDSDARRQIVGIELRKIQMAARASQRRFEPIAPDFDIDRVSEAMDTLSGADISEITRRIKLKKIKERIADHKQGRDTSNNPITTEEFLETAQHFIENRDLSF